MLFEPLHPVRADDTLRDFWQEIKIGIESGLLPKVTLTLDRVHKLNRKLSKPLGFYHFSLTDQLLKLTAQLLAATVTLALYPRIMAGERLDPYYINKQLENALNLVRADALRHAETLIDCLHGLKSWR